MAGPLSTKRWQDVRAFVLLGDPPCALKRDGCTGRATTVDHIVPRSKGGSMFDLTNLRPSCASCNSSRGNGTRTDHQASRTW